MSKDYSLEYYTPETLPNEQKDQDMSYTEEEWNALPNELRLRLIASDEFGWDNKDLIKAADEIKRLRGALEKYDCLHKCTEPCALYKMEKEREEHMPHMICGWWASAALKEGE